MLAGPSAFAIGGSMEELVEGRIPRNGNIEIRFCKPAAAGAGPSSVNHPNHGAGNFTPVSGRTIPYDQGDVPKGNHVGERKPGGGDGGGPDGGDGGNGKWRWRWEH